MKRIKHYIKIPKLDFVKESHEINVKLIISHKNINK